VIWSEANTGRRNVPRARPETGPDRMTDRRSHICRPSIVAMLLLGCLGSWSELVGCSGGIEPPPPEIIIGSLIGNTWALRGRPAPDQAAPGSRLAYTADELRDRLRRTPAPSDGRTVDRQQPSRTLGVIKGTEGDYVTANCADLTLTLVKLLRKFNSLKKREHSLFSGLTDSEKQELEETNQKLTAVRTVLKARCSTPSAE